MVAGTFYPNDIIELNNLIKGFIPEKTGQISARGIILPHAGYAYSGKVAVSTVASVLPKNKIIILGNNHSGYGGDFSLWPRENWKIPGGQAIIDRGLAKDILAKAGPIEEDLLAHISEHSIEAELPILNYFFKSFEFVPIACKLTNLSALRAAAEQIYQAVKPVKDKVLLVASSDFTHYEPDATARRKDRAAIDKIISLDEEALINEVTRENITLCGLAPIVVLICCLKKIGARKSQVTLYQTSADTNGDKTSAVGYAGIIFK